MAGDDIKRAWQSRKIVAMNNEKPDSNQLQQALSQLHTVLMRTPRVEEASKRAVRQALGDIERSLGGGGAVAESRSRLQALAVNFEAEHPSLAAGLREFVDLLGQAGL
jgi:hypothetical protein